MRTTTPFYLCALLTIPTACSYGERTSGPGPAYEPTMVSTTLPSDDDDDDDLDDWPDDPDPADLPQDDTDHATGTDGSTDTGESSESGEPPIPGAECDAVRYVGTCFHGVSFWSDDGMCRVRDCPAEGLGCGWISDDEGWGCVPTVGNVPPNPIWCEDIGPTGACLSDDVRVWVQDGSCFWQHCAASGQSCTLTANAIYECA